MEQYVVLNVVNSAGVESRYYFDAQSATFKMNDTFTSGPAYQLVPRVVIPLRAEDYPVLAEIWDNDEDDAAFGDW